MPTSITDFKSFVLIIIDLVQNAVLVIAGLAFLAFIWGLVKFIFRIGGDVKAVENGKSFMLWGLIALFVMLSIWGIIALLSNSLGFGSPLAFPLLPSQ